jgi:hypothetical protein
VQLINIFQSIRKITHGTAGQIKRNGKEKGVIRITKAACAV